MNNENDYEYYLLDVDGIDHDKDMYVRVPKGKKDIVLKNKKKIIEEYCKRLNISKDDLRDSESFIISVLDANRSLAKEHPLLVILD